MTALDDAYEAATEVLGSWTFAHVRLPFSDTQDAAHAAVDAFLAHLADNPPEPVLTAAFIAFGKGEDEQDAMRLALSAALRSITTEKAFT